MQSPQFERPIVGDRFTYIISNCINTHKKKCLQKEWSVVVVFLLFKNVVQNNKKTI